VNENSTRIHAHATELVRYAQYVEADELFRQYVKLNDGARDPLLVVALQNIGFCKKKLGDDDQAAEWYVRALDLARSIGYLPAQADLLSNLAVLRKNKARAALESGDQTGAVKHFEDAELMYKEARAVDRKTGNLPGVVLDLYNLGILYTHMQQPSTAKGAFDECMVLATSLDDHVMIGKAQWGVGRLFVSTGKLDAAAEMLEQAIASLRRTGDVPSLAHVCSNLGALCLHRNELSQAHKHLSMAKTLFSALGQTTPEARECDALLTTVTARLGP
jgi:tetratricopeptide (TPR) repeat protein